MERIKQAIEKAKQQVLSQPVHRPSVPRTHVAHKQSPEIGELNYSQTQIVELSPEHLEQHRIVAYKKNDALSGVFDVLRTQVLLKMKEHGWRTLAITSPTPEAGKTVVAINLAMSIAHHTNTTAMLVDFDLRRPKLGAYLGLPMEKSLNELLSGSAELKDILVNPGIPRLVLLPTKMPVARSSETLSSSMVSNLIADMRERYDTRIVIFDLPPIFGSDDVIAILPQIDCVLLVVANNMTAKSELEDCIRHLGSANLLGVVLNKGEADLKGYYY